MAAFPSALCSRQIIDLRVRQNDSKLGWCSTTMYGERQHLWLDPLHARIMCGSSEMIPNMTDLCLRQANNTSARIYLWLAGLAAIARVRLNFER